MSLCAEARARFRTAALVVCLLAVPAAGLAAEEGSSSNIPKLVNFTILAGLLIYVLGKPVANFLDARARQIREELAASRTDREEASRALELAGALDAARSREAEETELRITEAAVAEGRRIVAAAEAQAKKLTANAHAEIEAEIRAAERRLAASAARAAVRAAREQLTAKTSDADHARMVRAGVEEMVRAGVEEIRSDG